MTIRTLQSLSTTIRDRAVKEYRRARVQLTVREVRRETESEIREALRAHDLGSVAFD